LGKLLKVRIPVLIGHDDDVMGHSKHARKWGVSRLTFLPNLWWEYLDWAKDARTVVDQVTGGRPSPGMRALLNFIDQFIGESLDGVSIVCHPILWNIPPPGFGKS
jgi:hypothetical protein